MSRKKIVMVSLLLTPLSLGDFLNYAVSDPGGKNVLPLAIKELQPTETSKDIKYSGSITCKKCHEKEYTDISKTWHANMLKDFNPSFVKADFNNVEISYRDVEIENKEKEKVKISPLSIRYCLTDLQTVALIFM